MRTGSNQVKRLGRVRLFIRICGQQTGTPSKILQPGGRKSARARRDIFGPFSPRYSIYGQEILFLARPNERRYIFMRRVTVAPGDNLMFVCHRKERFYYVPKKEDIDRHARWQQLKQMLRALVKVKAYVLILQNVLDQEWSACLWYASKAFRLPTDGDASRTELGEPG